MFITAGASEANATSENSPEKEVILDNGLCIYLTEVYGETCYSVVEPYGSVSGDVVIPDSYMGVPIRIIRIHAFYNNNEITSVTIPDTVWEIEDGAFDECDNLKWVNLSNNLMKVHESAFGLMKNLEEYRINGSPNGSAKTFVYYTNWPRGPQKGYQNFFVRDGVLFSNDSLYFTGTTHQYFQHVRMESYPCGKKDSVYKIPNDVICLDKAAFLSPVYLDKIVIPSSVRYIIAGAIYYYDAASMDLHEGPVSVVFQHDKLPEAIKHSYVNESGYTESDIIDYRIVKGSLYDLYTGSELHFKDKTAKAAFDELQANKVFAYDEPDSSVPWEPAFLVSPKATTELSFDDNITEVELGESVTIYATQTPIDTTDDLEFSTSDESIASFDAFSRGILTGNAVGTVTYQVKSGDCVIERTLNVVCHHRDAEGNSTESDWIIDRETSCTEDGIKHTECLKCGEVFKTETTEKYSHTLETGESAYSFTKDVSFTCTEDGYSLYTCSLCGCTEKRNVVPAHHIENTTVVNPTCTEQGYTAHTCTVCKQVRKEAFVDSLGHKESDWIIDKNPACAVSGVKHKECTVCGTTLITEEIPALSHVCSTEWTIDVAPTCTEKGSKSHHCTVCDAKTDVTEIEALGHTPSDEWIIDKRATCTENGHKILLCSVCDEIIDEDEVITNGHTPRNAWTVDKKATCTEPGHKSLHCSICRAVLEEVDTEPTGHVLTSWIRVSSPSCKQEGKQRRQCMQCTYEEYIVIPKLEHTYSQHWTIDVLPTCTSEGTMSHHCTVCGCAGEDVTVVPKTSHTSSGWITDKEPTCAKEGTAHTVCTVCGIKLDTARVEKTDHKSSDWIVDKKATASAVGSKHKECTVCGEVLEKGTIPQLKCAVPKLTKIENASNGIKITWGKTSGADSYNIYRKTYSNGKWSDWSAIKTGATGASYTDKNVKSGVYYIYTVRAKNEAGLSSFNSTGLKIKFLATPKLSSISNGSGKVTVKWSKVSGASSYTVYRKTYSNGKWSGWSKIGTTKNTYYNDTKVSSGKYYKYTVRATSGDYSSSYNSTGLKIKYLAVAPLKSATSQKSGVKITWGSVSGAKGYEVYRKTYTNGKWSGWTNIKTVSGGSTVSYTDKTAKKGVTYKYTVRAISDSNKGCYNTSGLQVKDKY